MSRLCSYDCYGEIPRMYCKVFCNSQLQKLVQKLSLKQQMKEENLTVYASLENI